MRALLLGRGKAGPHHDELFNLKADPSESKDVLTGNEEQAAKMKKVLQEARDRAFTRPGAE